MTFTNATTINYSLATTSFESEAEAGLGIGK